MVAAQWDSTRRPCELTPDAGTVVYSGPARLRTPSGVEREVLFGESQVTSTRFAVTIPHDSPQILIDDVVAITASDDPHIANRSFRVVLVPSASYLIYRELGVEADE